MTQEQIVKDENRLIIDIITNAIKIPGVRVNRDDFLSDFFQSVEPEMLGRILDFGPVDAGYDRATLRKLAKGLVNKRTLESSGASFAAGLPGGWAMAEQYLRI